MSALSKRIFLIFALSCVGFAQQPAALKLNVSVPFKFVAYGDIRFADPGDHNASDFARRTALVKRIADENPAFITISGDLVLSGDPQNWHFWDKETEIWREQKIPVLPTLGNHDVRGGAAAMDNYFQRFPDLRGSRWYSARAGNVLIISLDTTGDGVGGPQLAWLKQQLNTISSDVDFVLFSFHHPPYTRSQDLPNGGHSARPAEQDLARLLEAQQQNTRARFLVITGHVHNYEHFQRGGVTYIVSGGGGAKPYMVTRQPGDPYTDQGPTYHYCTLEVDKGTLRFSMYKLDMEGGRAKFTKRDGFELRAPAAASARVGQ